MRKLYPLFLFFLFTFPAISFAEDQPLRLSWNKKILQIHGDSIPGGKIEIWYLEAYCRPGSTDRDWHETVIPHETKLVSSNNDGTQLQLKCTLEDGVELYHIIKSSTDEVAFQVKAHNPTKKKSQAHWAQPCMRVGAFTGYEDPADKYAYIQKSFVFLDDKLAMMPTTPWSTNARYIPGQVWAAPGVDRDDVNPRPLNEKTPSNGLIGCFSKDDSMILAMAWDPYQELFQGVIRCLHSDFRIGGLNPGETKMIHGKVYLLPNNVEGLLERYQNDFPKHE
ncbi:hypothetical protein [Rubinisphaera sp.]|uniref:hypothetical protein n=1 Tax=Rubinisphaera sp. TaxID=2024857 RepID=UPI000C0D5C53|nr:hypothetical protein [Rubinisphaera sp.]MBV08357.1 hypothetical protein [Rubinisphaera sp.]|tara:strand:+ start:4453 stop:5289 length:837 start_codon:yes stop_codon:yes gene_type:complete